MSVERQQVVQAARAWLDTPFLHQGRVLGKGVDCAGVVIKVAHVLGLSAFDAFNYSRSPDGVTLRSALDEHMDVVEFKAMAVGDVVLMSFLRQPQHLAIVTAVDPFYILHSDAFAPGGGRVVEHRLDSEWQRRIRGIYRYRGVG